VPVAATSAHSKLSNLLQLDRFEEDLNISRVRLHAPSASVARSSAALSDPSSPLSTADQETTPRSPNRSPALSRATPRPSSALNDLNPSGATPEICSKTSVVIILTNFP
jgi:hypothetical protein